jgi:hypothetical protein
VQINFLLPEAQCRPSFAEMNDLHPQHPGIKLAGLFDIGHRQDQVIKPFDMHNREPPVS